MAHAYTPGLRVTDHARAAPRAPPAAQGRGAGRAASASSAETVVARTELPGNVQTREPRRRLASIRRDVRGALLRAGRLARCTKGEIDRRSARRCSA